MFTNTISALRRQGQQTRRFITTKSYLMNTQNSLRVALLQLNVSDDKARNLSHADELVSEAAQKGAELVILPECFNCPYGNDYFPKYAETRVTDTQQIAAGVSESAQKMSLSAKKNKVFLVAGSIPTRAQNSLYNTSYVFNTEGNLVAHYNKIHLFDVNVPGGIVFQESKTLTAGSHLACFDVKNARIGLGICFDIRFPELASLYAQQQCNMLVYPGAFNMTTGPLHWELLARARAVDQQSFVCVVSPARDTKASYTAWGHSMCVDPWGHKLVEADAEESMLIVDVDLNKANQMRSQIPTLKNKRSDLYQVNLLKAE